MMSKLPRLLSIGLIGLSLAQLQADPARDSGNYVEAIEKVNAVHAKKPGDATEGDLADKVPRQAVVGLARLLRERPSEEINAALVACGEAALDLAIEDHFLRIRKRLLEIDPDSAAILGDAAVRERFVVRGIGGLGDEFLDDFADLLDGVLDAYEEVFGFAEWSKVPGKKIRIRIHLEDQITRPPHFAPQFPYHSEIDMPVINAAGFKSPTPKGQMMFYGLCHELGHLIAMWGDRRNQEDHHAWAHYTGVVIVEHMATSPQYKKLLADRRDVRWRSLSMERKKPENAIDPSGESKPGVMVLLIKLHDLAGPKMIGDAMNRMDEEDTGHRINHVRYYSFSDLKKALGEVCDDRERRETIREVFP